MNIANYMGPKKSVVQFNHIDGKLSEGDAEQLKAWYRHYHRLSKLYEWSYRDVRRKRVILDFGSLGVAAVGLIVGDVTMNAVVTAVVGGAGLIVNGSARLLDLKDAESAYRDAHEIYSELTVRIQSYLRGISYAAEVLVSDMALLDEMVARKTPHLKQKHKDRYAAVYASP